MFSLHEVVSANSRGEALRLLDQALRNPRFAIEDLEGLAETLPSIALILADAASASQDEALFRCFNMSSTLVAALARIPSSQQYALPLRLLPRHLADVILTSAIVRKKYGSIHFPNYFTSSASRVDPATKSLILSAEDYFFFSFILLPILDQSVLQWSPTKREWNSPRNRGTALPAPPVDATIDSSQSIYDRLLSSYIKGFCESVSERDKSRGLFLLSVIVDLWLFTDGVELSTWLNPTLLTSTAVAVTCVVSLKDFGASAQAPSSSVFPLRLPREASLLLPSVVSILRGAIAGKSRSSSDLEVTAGILNLWICLCEPAALKVWLNFIAQYKDAFELIPLLLSQPPLVDFIADLSSSSNPDSLLSARGVDSLVLGAASVLKISLSPAVIETSRSLIATEDRTFQNAFSLVATCSSTAAGEIQVLAEKQGLVGLFTQSPRMRHPRPSPRIKPTRISDVPINRDASVVSAWLLPASSAEASLLLPLLLSLAHWIDSLRGIPPATIPETTWVRSVAKWRTMWAFSMFCFLLFEDSTLRLLCGLLGAWTFLMWTKAES